MNDKVLPIYYSQGYKNLRNGMYVSVGKPLEKTPITALHFHHCIELGICLEGEGETIIENKIFSFKKGDYQVIGANVAHLAHTVGVEQCVWLWIYVDYQDLEFKLGGLSFPKTGYNGIFEKSKYPKLSEIIDNIVYNNDCDDQYSAMENALLVAQLLIELSRIGNVHNIGSNRVSSKIAPVLLYISEHYFDFEGLDEKSLASICNLSVSQFRLHFKHETGMTLPRFINKTKLYSALYQLSTSNDTILEIAQNSGYSSISNFNKAFKKEFGDSPSVIRKLWI